MSGAVAIICFGLFLAAYGAMVRFATRGQKDLSAYASMGLRVARVVVPLGMIIFVLGLAVLGLAVFAGQ